MSTGELLRPHVMRFVVVALLQVIGAVGGLAPLLAVVELGRAPLSPGPVARDHVWTVVILGAVGLFVRLVFNAASSGLGHILDGKVQLSLRRALAAGLGRAPIGWFSRRRTGELAKVVGDDVSAVHPFIAHAPGELVSAFVVPLVVKAFGGAGRAHRRFRTAADDFVDIFTRWVRGVSAIAAGMQTALSPPFVLVVVLIGRAVGRIRDVLGVPALPEPTHPVAPHDNRVELRNVRFGYDDGHEVLRGIDLVLEPGTVTAPIGPSGSGKSTLVQLLPRFFDPTAGSIRLGGVDLRDIAGRELYRRVSFVFQDVRLLRASVADNIALAVPHADLDDVVRAARLAQIHDRIVHLPRGYETVIGDEVKLSGGEAQRIALAPWRPTRPSWCSTRRPPSPTRRPTGRCARPWRRFAIGPF